MQILDTKINAAAVECRHCARFCGGLGKVYAGMCGGIVCLYMHTVTRRSGSKLTSRNRSTTAPPPCNSRFIDEWSNSQWKELVCRPCFIESCVSSKRLTRRYAYVGVSIHHLLIFERRDRKWKKGKLQMCLDDGSTQLSSGLETSMYTCTV